ncbi:ATP-dependent DNA helicase RecG [Agrilactobacillus fermenti]|uniref:ATP-dependent DNA helicase RecG n=1 Tax=Agrilactobacillus fermenti TaxID=2586909 RepID=UPI003A5C57DE
MLKLSDSVETLSGVGAKRVTALNSLGIFTINDLLFYFPFRYDDLKVKSLAEVTDQEKITLKGTVIAAPILNRFGPNKNRLIVRLLVEHQVVIVTFFNQPWLKDRFIPDTVVAVFGKWDQRRRGLTGMKFFSPKGDNDLAGIYSVNKNIRQSTLIKLVKLAFEKYQSVIGNLVPIDIRQRYRLLDDREIITGMHFPKTAAEVKAAHRSAVFREFFVFECRMQAMRQKERQGNQGLSLKYQLAAVQDFIHELPFELTQAQKRVVNEIAADMKRPYQMNRLLQGDVGSGKTIVAAIALFSAVTAGYQAALMVPTEILATQHFEKLQPLFAKMNVVTTLLTGATTNKNRRKIDENLVQGRVNILIGTHALIQESVHFKNLGFVVIDEQHRFGVNQRKALREKGLHPDVLMMTATPIPRTLAITTYGEMDVSTIDQLPSGRKPIKTYWLKNNQDQQAFAFVRRQLVQHNQAFVISPLIEESETMDLKNAELLYERYREAFAPEYEVALLHGQMSNDDKNTVMAAFAKNEVQILVATTVVEVGVDVPNANTMIIYDADRFGLSQLHQLRGRVGRGQQQAYCLLVAQPKNEVAVARLQAMTETNDGFVLSEKDLELRGPGDVFGQKQSGLPDFQIGDPVADFNVLQVAQTEAQQIFVDDPSLSKAEHQTLRTFLKTTIDLKRLD